MVEPEDFGGDLDCEDLLAGVSGMLMEEAGGGSVGMGNSVLTILVYGQPLRGRRPELGSILRQAEKGLFPVPWATRSYYMVSRHSMR